MEEKEKQEKKRRRPMSWLAWGLIWSVTAAVLYMCCYRLFRMSAEKVVPENPLETQTTANMLARQSYVLYHDLQQKQDPDRADYLKLYIKPEPEYSWVLDEKLMDLYFSGEEVDSSVFSKLPADCGSVYGYLRYLKKEYFEDLEEQFSSQVVCNFDYFCRDTETGVCLTNTGLNEIDPEEQYFYLSLKYDEYGNCETGDVKLGQDASLLRRYANVAARAVRLESDRAYENFNDESGGATLDTYFATAGPVNCEIIYCISNAEWKLYEKGEAQILLNNQYYSVGTDSYTRFRVGGMEQMLAVMLLLVGGLAFYMPVAVKCSPETGRPVSRWLRLPPEVLAAGGFLVICGGIDVCMDIVLSTLSGSVARELADVLGAAPRSTKIQLLTLGSNFYCLLLLFFSAWYIGVNLRDLRRLKGKAYIRERSLIYRFFPYIRSKIWKLYDTLAHFDLTQKSNKMILRIVVINGVILCLISALWLGGWGFALAYSVLLYLFLRKYVSDLQKKYGVLLRATNEIAEGNLNVQIQEDLGVFEPFRPQIYRIQEGFRRAVDEEVKSQRMKAELITNVSHDLKTPLTAIITYVNLLKEENITEEQRREYLETLERKSLRLKALIEDLFEVSKANSQNMTLNLMDVDVMNLVKQVAFEMGDKLKEQKLDLRLALPEEKVILRLDSQRTYRIYENLFANIAKYAMPGTRVYVNGFQVEDTVVITLKNIAAEEIPVKPEELTERFVRGDASRNTEGSGLGLAIVKSFLELQGGMLELEVDGDLFKVTTVWKK